MSSIAQTTQASTNSSNSTSPLYMQNTNKKSDLPIVNQTSETIATPTKTQPESVALTNPEQQNKSTPLLQAEYNLPVEDSASSVGITKTLEASNLNQKNAALAVQDTNASQAQDRVDPNLNVNSIISGIKEDLDSTSQGEVVTETEVPNTPEPSTNVLKYNLNAQDTFQENYKDQIEINKPIKIQSTSEGVIEIKPIEKDIPVQVLEDVESANNLQFKTYSLEEILKEAISRKASDVHFTVGYRATFRIDGQLKTFNSQILTAQNIKEFAQTIIQHRKDIEIDNIKEFDLTYTIEGKRFRVNIFKQLGLYSIVCRVINETILSLENLGLPITLNSLSKFPNGLIIVTGPTGSGKSTTMASLLNNINLSESKHIVTLEDPVEYLLPKGFSIVDQREFGTDFMSWPNALRSVLRQDPDIVLIGEMRDMESIESALQVAETGHLVFATLHTNSAAQSIDRIVDVFPAEKQSQIKMQLASVLRAIVSQRLIPLTKGGRRPAVEVAVANTAVQNAIREGKVFLIDNVIQTSAEEGMISLEKSLVQMVKEGLISTQTAKNYSLKPNEIDLLLSK